MRLWGLEVVVVKEERVMSMMSQYMSANQSFVTVMNFPGRQLYRWSL